jgi:hypothetical protein
MSENDHQHHSDTETESIMDPTGKKDEESSDHENVRLLYYLLQSPIHPVLPAE